MDASQFENQLKNYPLAKEALTILNDATIELLALKGYSRAEAAVLFTAVDAALMTSFTEGSPQFVKEAIACNCPVVSTDVGDVKKVIEDIEGCFIASYEPKDVAEKIRKSIHYGELMNGRERIAHFDNREIARKLIALYHQIS
mgnify:CR=1 FL=1